MYIYNIYIELQFYLYIYIFLYKYFIINIIIWELIYM